MQRGLLIFISYRCSQLPSSLPISLSFSPFFSFCFFLINPDLCWGTIGDVKGSAKDGLLTEKVVSLIELLLDYRFVSCINVCQNIWCSIYGKVLFSNAYSERILLGTLIDISCIPADCDNNILTYLSNLLVTFRFHSYVTSIFCSASSKSV